MSVKYGRYTYLPTSTSLHATIIYIILPISVFFAVSAKISSYIAVKQYLSQIWKARVVHKGNIFASGFSCTLALVISIYYNYFKCESIKVQFIIND